MNALKESIAKAVRDGQKMSDDALIKIGRQAVVVIRANEKLAKIRKEFEERQEFLKTLKNGPMDDGVVEHIGNAMKAMSELATASHQFFRFYITAEEGMSKLYVSTHSSLELKEGRRIFAVDVDLPEVQQVNGHIAIGVD